MCVCVCVCVKLWSISQKLFQIFCCNFLHSVQLQDAQIILKFQINRTNSVANTTAQSFEFCVHHISRTAVGSLKFFSYSILMLLNLDLISFWATSDKHGCHFT
ncbi:hypothetical protein O3M35_010223 [Rhynocoris fuscipes]|uniref:Secreted protein n=1 Tax=Rhynocoris fuscipes TaxID=488301 RepID=A0AAW1CY36_9HEMI